MRGGRGSACGAWRRLSRRLKRKAHCALGSPRPPMIVARIDKSTKKCIMQHKVILMEEAKKTYTFGAYVWFGYMLPFKEKLDAIKRAGFDNICLWWDDNVINCDGSLAEQIDIAYKFDLHVEHAHIPYYDCNKLWKDCIDGVDLMNMCIKSVELAYCLNVPTLVMHPFELKKPVDGSTKIFMERFKKITQVCANKEIRFAVENLADNDCLKSILRSNNDNPYVGLCFDSGHNNIVSKDFSLLTEFSKKVFALHLHDNDSISDSHLLPFEGNVNWKVFIKALKNTSFTGSLMLEACFPFDYSKLDTENSEKIMLPDIPMDEYLLKAYDSLKKLSSFV